MGTEDTAERLARIEALMGGMQAEMAAMRDALIRLVRIEEQHAGTREDIARQQEAIRRMHERLDHYDDRLDKHDERLDGIEQSMASIRGPLLWLAGIAASVVAGLVSLVLGRVL
jgi:septation ring formation regulator EzrA